MDWLVFSDFVEAVRDRKPMPIDVYDMAAWMSIFRRLRRIHSSRKSADGIPDFTNGAWMVRKKVIFSVFQWGHVSIYRTRPPIADIDTIYI